MMWGKCARNRAERVARRTAQISALPSRAASRRLHLMLVPVLLVMSQCPFTAESALKVGDNCLGPSGGVFARSNAHHARSVQGLERGPAFVSMPSLSTTQRLLAAQGLCGTFAPYVSSRDPHVHNVIGVAGSMARARLHLGAAGAGSQDVHAQDSDGTRRTVTRQSYSPLPFKARDAENDGSENADILSAQERRMLCVLSKFGRLRSVSAESAEKNPVGRKILGFSGQEMREQKDEMEKERRDEKLALRRRHATDTGRMDEERSSTAGGFGASGSNVNGLTARSMRNAGALPLSGHQRNDHKSNVAKKLAMKRGLDMSEHDAPSRNAGSAGVDTGPAASKHVRVSRAAMQEQKPTRLVTKPVATMNSTASRYVHLDGAVDSPPAGGNAKSLKHGAVPTKKALKTSGADASPATSSRPIPIPHNLANYSNLVALLGVLDPFCAAIGFGYGCSNPQPHGACCVGAGVELSPSSASDAVGALNRLKRLRNQATNRHLEARMSACMECLGAVVHEGMPLLSGKLVSLTVNAVAHTRRHTRLMVAASNRAIEIAQSGDANALDVQAVSVILNGFARAGMRDVPLFTNMSAVAMRLMETNSSDFGAQAISVIANAFAKVRLADEELFGRLAHTCTQVPAADFTPQAIANIMNAYARHDMLDVKLLRFLSSISRQSMPSLWMSRHLAVVVNALAKLEHRDDELLQWVADAALSRPTSSFDVQAISNILNGYGKLYGSAMDRQLLEHMAQALVEMPSRALDPQSVASCLNALLKVGYQDDRRDLFRKLSHVALHLDPLLFDAQSVSTIMHAVAKLGLHDDKKLFRRLAVVVGQMEFVLEAQSIALITNACAKAEYRDERLMKHISRIACSLPADTLLPQHVENLLNGFARLDVRDRALFLHMAEVIRLLPVDSFDSQAVAIIMNSFARVMGQDPVTAHVFHYFSHEVLPEMATTDLQATSLSIILNAFAKAEIRDDNAIARLCSMIVAEDALLLQGGHGGVALNSFDGRHIASVLHAVATLHIEQPTVLDDLLDRLITLDPQEQQPEEVAIIAWSVAVLNLKRLDVLEWLMRGLDLYIENLDSNFRRQAHQFLLTCELDGFPANCDSIDGDWRPTGALRARGLPSKPALSAKEVPGKEMVVHLPPAQKILSTAEHQYKALRCKAEEQEVQLDYAVSQHRPSRLQRDVALILTEMDIKFVEEYVDERSGYSVDMLLSDQRTAIEVDGPSHYAAGTQRPLGNTNMKHRHLAQLGFDLRILPYWEWDKLKSKEQKKAYIRELLTSTPSLTPSP